MSLARAWSVALLGVRGHLVRVEADISNGLPTTTLIGLPDAALAEARDRIRAAIVNSAQKWPQQRITLALSPADLRKHGSCFDVPLAVAVLAADGVIPAEALAKVVLVGELGLDGKVRGVRGVLPMVAAAVRAGFTQVLVPPDNASEAALLPEVEVRAVATLRDLVELLNHRPCEVLVGRPAAPVAAPTPEDMADVVGQAEGRRAIEVAAAGGHHVHLHGAPGAGKTMLARRLPGILPPLDAEAALEVTAVHSVAGILPPESPLVRVPPFQSPHHTATIAALVGGGSGMPRPGAISCAHHGVLFLDEAPEFAGRALDCLREPMERGDVTVARAGGSFRFPAQFQLVLASNPCPCASPAGDAACTCPPGVRRRYQAKLSGPLMDRVDLQVQVQPLSRVDLLVERPVSESSAIVAARVRQAREAAAERLRGTGWRLNSEVPGPALRTRWRLPAKTLEPATRSLENGTLSARGFDRVLRVAWTVGDLEGHLRPDYYDVSEAVGLRIGRGP